MNIPICFTLMPVYSSAAAGRPHGGMPHSVKMKCAEPEASLRKSSFVKGV